MRDWWMLPEVKAASIVAGAIFAAFVTSFLFRRVVIRLARRTKSKLDDQLAEVTQSPIFWSIILVGVAWAVRLLPWMKSSLPILDGALKSIAVVVWSITLVRAASLIFGDLASNRVKNSLIQPRTQPLFDIFSKLFVIAGASYAVLLAWNINVGAWMASAGVVGIALGFAAKDSLSNLFAGIFIVADAPYSVGDFIVLDDKLRGAVTAIGFRSTRLLTLDDVEIVVPNSLIGNARIVNESGGPHRMARVSITVECAYGSDADLVKEVMLGCADGAIHVVSTPAPMVRFSEFGGSGLVHELLVWIERPKYRERVVDDLNRRVYKAFAANGIEIPYSKHDVFIKEIAGAAGIRVPPSSGIV